MSKLSSLAHAVLNETIVSFCGKQYLKLSTFISCTKRCQSVENAIMLGDNKNVPTEHRKWTKAERQYIKGIVHNYSLQRWTDQDIVNYLREEKKIRIGRSTVTRIKNSVVEEGEKWYIELRDSGAKYIAVYKERLDSLLSYQKKLHELCTLNQVPS